jgi:D-glycero-alpha-D-manno-heptose-7-phosphate kinase
VASTASDGAIHISADTCRGCEEELAALRDGESERLAQAALSRFSSAELDARGVDLFLTTDIPPGSGLGSTSAMSVALVRALSMYLGLPMDTRAVADVASSVAIGCLGPSVGKQDPYASAFGGCTTIDTEADTVSLRRLDLRLDVRRHLLERLLLFWTGGSRDGTRLSAGQVGNSSASLLAARWLHELKALAQEMGQALVEGDLDLFGRLLDMSWQYTKRLFPAVRTDQIDGLYERALNAGALGGKVTGPSGGFLLLYCPPGARDTVRTAMRAEGLRETRFAFDEGGVTVLPALQQEQDRTRLARTSLTRRRRIEQGSRLPVLR